MADFAALSHDLCRKLPQDDIDEKFATEYPVVVDIVVDIGLVGHDLSLREGGAVLGDHLRLGGTLALFELVIFGEQPQDAPVVAGSGLGLNRRDQRMAEIVSVRQAEALEVGH